MNEGFDFSNIVRNIGRRWKEIIMIAFIAAFAAGTVSCFMYRPEYRTKATIVVLEKEMYKERRFKCREHRRHFQRDRFQQGAERQGCGFSRA